MMRPPVNWSEQPGDKRPMLKILRAPIDGLLELTIISERDFGVFIHWVERLKRNQPCTDPYGCLCQSEILPVSWKTYLAVQEVRGGKIRLVEVPSMAWTECQGVKWLENRGSLRGCRIALKRLPHTKQGKVIATLYDPVVADIAALPPCPNVKDELQRIWFVRL